MWIIFAAILPAIVLFHYIYRKDRFQKEPTRELVRGFILGVASAFLSLTISIPLTRIGFVPEEPTTLRGFMRLAFWGAAIPEELAKAAMLWLLLRNNKYFDEHFDGIVYAATIGLGFAAFENIEYLFANLDNWLTVGVTRALISVPAHFFFAIMMGYFVSMAMFGGSRMRRYYYAMAIIVPVLAHGTFDAILMTSEGIPWLSGILSLAFIAFFIFIAKKSSSRISELLCYDEQKMTGEVDDQSLEA